jgi:hypothetical protein
MIKENILNDRMEICGQLSEQEKVLMECMFLQEAGSKIK